MKKTLKMLTVASLALSALMQSAPAMAQSADVRAPAQSVDKSHVKQGGSYYVAADKLNLRSAPTTDSSSLIGALRRNDQVEVVDLLGGSSPLVEIRIIKSASATNQDATRLYVSAEYLTITPAAVVTDSGNSKYFIVLNVATERSRIYERCTTSPGCPHKMIFETEIVVGRPEGPKGNSDAFLTRVGRFKLLEWKKFYQDGAAHYPSWYHPSYMMPPPAGASPKSWISKKYVPNPEVNTYRGAFGWYAAMMGPNADSQWLHGTYGWGADGNTFIKYTRKKLLNMFADPRSSGCLRHENMAIAFIRQTLPVGTDILRVYAREAYRDESRAAYAHVRKTTKPWEFILTKDGSQKSNGSSADAGVQRANGVSRDQILETGTYQIDQYPDGVGLSKNAGWSDSISGKSGNSYRIDDNGFRGAFLVDEGRFVDYRHPSGVPRGGYDESSLPEQYNTSGAYSLAEPLR